MVTKLVQHAARQPIHDPVLFEPAFTSHDRMMRGGHDPDVNNELFDYELHRFAPIHNMS
ncbi:MAG: hypothetical protein H0X39_12200 [Actinobacteria bacterium]|nr:hypothetical protein [Actinomycetota bacterium]